MGERLVSCFLTRGIYRHTPALMGIHNVTQSAGLLLSANFWWSCAAIELNSFETDMC